VPDQLRSSLLTLEQLEQVLELVLVLGLELELLVFHHLSFTLFKHRSSNRRSRQFPSGVAYLFLRD
jgi:hypothetical protein